mmetsp:Transcript_18924/g.27846  ORF Transcript_18924/g.27846 Transcript_18924/m.27846 type:complete len:132 (+) Transcript_18924:129-524(+)
MGNACCQNFASQVTRFLHFLLVQPLSRSRMFNVVLGTRGDQFRKWQKKQEWEQGDVRGCSVVRQLPALDYGHSPDMLLADGDVMDQREGDGGHGRFTVQMQCSANAKISLDRCWSFVVHGRTTAELILWSQ